MPSPLARPWVMLLCIAVVGARADVADAQIVPYNPYAETQESLPPVAADGTLHWGSFYKSAAIQQTYERLWNLGACRGTNRAITGPVERNKLRIDDLPEDSFDGVVRAAAGTARGGLIAFAENGSPSESTPVLVAQLHPAGVTQLRISGPASVACLKPGTTVRLLAQVDQKGRSTSPIRAVEIVSPPADFVPDPVRPNVPNTVVGELQRVGDASIVVKVASGRIRRLTLSLSPETTVAVVDATRLDLVAPGDTVEVTGRRWAGDGCMGAGTVFASRVTVNKSPIVAVTPDQPGRRDAGVPSNEPE